MNLPTNSQQCPANFQLRSVPMCPYRWVPSIGSFRFLGALSHARFELSSACAAARSRPVILWNSLGLRAVAASQAPRWGSAWSVWNRDTRPLNVLKKVGIEAMLYKIVSHILCMKFHHQFESGLYLSKNIIM